ncbi:MAG: bifunctional 4-hydroxy-2-oxoglutarate aldolase/2-dehydro-3-deoxy-phosphogluconate aldolase [Anaerolineales bacterium]
MDKEKTLERLAELGVIAVLRGPSEDLTVKMVEALVEGGVRGIEITFTTPNATQVVRDLLHSFSEEIVLGMGTLTEPDHAEEAKQAGASFIVSPYTESSLASAMTDTGLVVMLGALTPSEVMRSLQLGSDIVKLFPGSAFGPDYLRALRGPYPQLNVMPTGGVDLDNLADWFAAGVFAVGAGSSLCPREWAQQGEFHRISKRAEQFMTVARQARSAT